MRGGKIGFLVSLIGAAILTAAWQRFMADRLLEIPGAAGLPMGHMGGPWVYFALGSGIGAVVGLIGIMWGRQSVWCGVSLYVVAGLMGVCAMIMADAYFMVSALALAPWMFLCSPKRKTGPASDAVRQPIAPLIPSAGKVPPAA